ncbi:MAG: serine/threonine protein kinase [Porphyromonadaceae bacterium]|nr:serine/threonine protein kinase [Porphyromonadaceae bacterium]
MELPTGHYLQNGKYQLTEVVGRGGFGITYRGIWFTEVKGALGKVKTEVPICIKEYFFKDYCYRDEQSFAVKVHSETGRSLFEKFKEKLIKEAKILSDVHHPHIVNVLEVFEENDTAYIAMEYIPGSSLKYLLEQNGQLSENIVLIYTHQIAQALQFVHEKNILHLDIKPSNILIDKDDNARLIDFGVSKRYDLAQQETSTTMLTLSKGFASIEQYDDEGTQNFSPCPDIYSLGATMYNLLTGKIPTESILRATKPLQKPSEINPSISTRTEAAIVRSMEINPADRFQSVNEFIAALGTPPEKEIKEIIKENSKTFTEEDITEIYPKIQKSESLDSISDNTYTLQKDKGGHLIDSEDDTIIQKTVLPPIIAPKKKLLIPVFASLLLFTGAGVGLTLFNSKSIQDPIDIDRDNKIIKNSSEKSLYSKPTSDTLVFSDRPAHETNILSVKELMPNKPAVKLTGPDTNANVSTGIESDITYTELIGFGKKKLAGGDYLGARVDFTKAKEISLTEEVLLFLIACDNKEEESKIVARKALYEEKMAFGACTIVRNKSTGKYGAIDEKGVECIPCIYLSVGKSEKGRAFEREDSLFDIYNSTYELVSKGVTYY